MSQALTDVLPDVQHLITEDDESVDNLPSEKQQRLLTEPLYSSWAGPGEGRTFLAAANVGVFYLARNPAIVPDMFLSLDVEVAEDWWQKEHRSYFLWEFGKPPDVAIEIVSNTVGEEDGEKKKKYARMKVSYYVICDPQLQVMPDKLTIYRLHDFEYERQESTHFPSLGLGLTLWEGEYEGKRDVWLRWVTDDGSLILTGKEAAQEQKQVALEHQQIALEQRQIAEQQRQLAQEQKQLAETQRQRAEQAEQLLQQERERAARMAELLRQLGKDPNEL